MNIKLGDTVITNRQVYKYIPTGSTGVCVHVDDEEESCIYYLIKFSGLSNLHNGVGRSTDEDCWYVRSSSLEIVSCNFISF